MDMALVQPSSPSPCEVVVPRGSREEKQQNRGSMGTGLPTGPQHTPSPSSAHPPGHVAFWMLPRSFQLPSPALEGF